MAFIESLDLWSIFVNNFAGSMLVFFFVAMAFIAYLASRFRMTNMIMLMMIGLFAVFMSPWFSMMYLIIILVAGLLIYLILSRMIKN